MIDKQLDLSVKLYSLVVFRKLLSHPVLKKFQSLISSAPSDPIQVSLAADFIEELFSHTTNFSRFLLEAVLEQETLFLKNIACQLPVPEEIESCLRRELVIIEEISRLSPQDICEIIGCQYPIPPWKTEELDFTAIYRERIANLSTKGYGIFAKYHTFRVGATDSRLIPVRSPDTTRLSQLEGYQNERQALIDNTLALLRGMPAANALLYGDAGTGKSSTVKAVVNEFREQGLRLVEVRKEQLRGIPEIIDDLNGNPLKFVLFIDDLSFSRDDDEFAYLKAVLEGSVAAKSSNIVVYATSNRRHLVKETFSNRSGDDVHLNDTLEEISSLSARFGLTITFLRPEKELYLSIVKHLAREYNITSYTRESIETAAEAFAIRRGGRSPRIARQFIEQLKTR